MATAPSKVMSSTTTLHREKSPPTRAITPQVNNEETSGDKGEVASAVSKGKKGAAESKKKSKQVKRKKQMTKHALSAREKELQVERAVAAATAAIGGGGDGKAATETKATADSADSEEATNARKKKKRCDSKDPSEATTYLSIWKRYNSGEGSWKFNKNTQSWLIRHMYDAFKVPKNTFADLVQYLRGLNKGVTRMRLEEDADRRARRYKEWEKSGGSVSSAREKEHDHEAWKALDDGDKRKEYKRARQIIDMLKETEKE